MNKPIYNIYSTLEEENRIQRVIGAVTTWEATLAIKDKTSAKKRIDEAVTKDFQLTNVAVKETRRKRLEELYRNDEIKYEAELQMKGLAFRRDRL